jgi:hypothetical protein
MAQAHKPHVAKLGKLRPGAIPAAVVNRNDEVNEIRHARNSAFNKTLFIVYRHDYRRAMASVH